LIYNNEENLPINLYILMENLGLFYGVWCHFQQCFSYLVVVSFIGGGNHWPVASH
jgi:hypothetical protein